MGPRSSIKPRLLFEEELQTRHLRSQAIEDEEEAVTDIDETVTMTTPKASKFAPATFGPVSPPTTARATRSMDVEMIDQVSSPASSDAHVSHSSSHVTGKEKSAIKKRGSVQTTGGRSKKVRG